MPNSVSNWYLCWFSDQGGVECPGKGRRGIYSKEISMGKYPRPHSCLCSVRDASVYIFCRWVM